MMQEWGTSHTSPTKRSRRGRVAITLRTLLMAADRLVGSATSRLMHTSCMHCTLASLAFQSLQPKHVAFDQ